MFARSLYLLCVFCWPVLGQGPWTCEQLAAELATEQTFDPSAGSLAKRAEQQRQWVEQSSACDRRTRRRARRFLTQTLWVEAKRLQQIQPSNPKLTVLLTEITQYNQSWKTLSWLADLHARDGAYVQAAQNYQAAIDVLNDDGKTPKAPPREDIRELIDKAINAQFLAKDYVPTTLTDKGRPSGLASDNVRGVIIKRRDVPVTFRFDSSAFTKKGRAAALDLAREINAKNPDIVTLIGHTDDVGTVQYNWALSVRRAQALGRFLQQQGVKARIIATGRGKSEAVLNYDKSLNLEQYRQRCRRVEVKFN